MNQFMLSAIAERASAVATEEYCKSRAARADTAKARAVLVESLRKAIGVSQAEMAQALGIPERTLARRKREGVLSSDESAKLLRLARAFGRANEVFEAPAAALDWLESPNSALAGKTPISLLDTEIGAESVLDTPGRIEHGVFA